MNFLAIASELIVGFAALLILTRILGKTQISQITPFDFISAIILGELVGNSLYDDKSGVLEILFAISLWGALIFFTEIMTQRSRRVRHFLENTPSIIIRKGQIQYEAIKNNHLDLNQMQQLLRAKDIFSIRECEYAILETDGSLSVVKKPNYAAIQKQDLNIAPTPASMPISVIMDGEIIYDNLKMIELDKEWLLNEISKKGYSSSKEILFGEWTDGEELLLQGY
ncbi:DUF421 domain-containing protein [Rossellomorea vietnamensis]|uniref:DUF421 domain-containing protein n=1 Tax=Rossellomorea vietnamensis TaxID=218284 RepID=A0A5D4NR66_9BACI|nr:DUF421 domain-containing protein [Rossellomorea vietnamensis]TYS15796.1 DUF421 domain-containing protein [Rossellomorea vietnamensis]